MSNFYNDYATKQTIIRNIRKWASKHNDLAKEVLVTHITPKLTAKNTLYITDKGDSYIKSSSSYNGSRSKIGSYYSGSRTTYREVKSGRVCAKLVLEDGSVIYADCRYGNGVANTPRLNAENEENQIKPINLEALTNCLYATIIGMVICIWSNSINIKLISGSVSVMCGLYIAYVSTPEKQQRKLDDWLGAKIKN